MVQTLMDIYFLLLCNPVMQEDQKHMYRSL